MSGNCIGERSGAKLSCKLAYSREGIPKSPFIPTVVVILDTYVTEGDGIRQAAANGRTVYDTDGLNARKQAEQYERLVDEIVQLV